MALTRGGLLTSNAARPCGSGRVSCSRRAACLWSYTAAGSSRRGRGFTGVRCEAGAPPAAPADRLGGADGAANSIVALPSPLSSWDAAAAQPSGADDAFDGMHAHDEQQPHEHIHGLGGGSQDIDETIEAAVHQAVEQELETINQAVHTAFEAELESLNQTVEQAVETALLDRSFDIKANLNTAVALTGVILYWRGIWNLADSLLGTDNTMANVGSVLIGLSVMLLFRIFKLPLAEFW